MRQTKTAFAAGHYVQRLDLGADPFAEGFHSDYFYGGASRRQMLDQVLHFSRYSDQTVLLVGSTGSGTSAVLDQLLDSLSSLMDFCTVDAEGVSGAAQLLAAMANQLQLDRADSITGFLAALRYRAERDDGNGPLLIAIDQAHYLDTECLGLLRQLREHGAGSLHLLLVGEYQTEQIAKLAGFDATQLKILELDPLNTTETGEYVLGLLQSVGYAGDQPLSVDQLAVLHEQSGGNIGEINRLVPALLNADARSFAARLNLSIPLPHLAAVVILVIAIGASYWYQGDEEAVGVETGDGETARQQVALELPRTEVAAPVEVPPPEPELADAASADSDAGGESGVVERRAAPPAEREASPQSHPHAALLEAQKREQETSRQEAAAKQRVATPAKPKPEPKPGTATPTPIASEPAAASPPPAKPAPAPSTSVAAVPAPAAKPEPQRKPAPRPVAAAPMAAASDVPPRERHLLDMEDSAYVLQLMGALDESRARELVKDYVGQLPIMYFESRRKGKPWFVVVTGPYESVQAARDGVSRLPVKLRKQQPWPRSVAGVKQEIRDNRS